MKLEEAVGLQNLLTPHVRWFGPPANAKGKEGTRACFSVDSRSEARIDLQVLPDYVSNAAVENRSSFAITRFGTLDAYIDEWI